LKKSIILLLAASFALTTACSDSDSKVTETTATPQSTGNPSTSAQPANSKISLRWMVPIGSDIANATLPSADKDFVKKAIEEKFNVDLKIEYMNLGNDYNNKLNVMLAGGDVPDIFIAGGAESQKYSNDGLLADLMTYITPQTMPNYYKWVKQEELDAFQLKDVKFNRAILPFFRNAFAAYYIRQDWLDKLGLQKPKSMAEMLDVMRKFTNNDPDGNNKKDTYGFTTSAGGAGLNLEFPQWLDNGFIADFQIGNNSFIDNRTDPGVQKVVQDIINMNNEGIIDPDWFLQKYPAHLDKAAQGKVGIFFSGDMTAAFEGVASSVQGKTKAINPKADWQPFNPFPDMKAIWKNGVPHSAILAGKLVADKKPENIKRSIEVLNWLAGEEGYLLTHYGQEGKHYKKTGKKVELIADAFENDITKQGNWLGIYRAFTPEEPSVLGLEVVDPRVSARDYEVLKTISSYPKYDALPPITFAPPPGIAIGDFRKEMNRLHIQMIFEDKNADKWPQYREELMTKFRGREIFQFYTDQLNAVLKGTKLNDFK
jgi:putative aldouronate transport system substrate-binding protein